MTPEYTGIHEIIFVTRRPGTPQQATGVDSLPEGPVEEIHIRYWPDLDGTYPTTRAGLHEAIRNAVATWATTPQDGTS